MICSRCKATEFRLSSLRLRDLPRLLLLHYPVRCRFCHRRAHAGILLALMLLQLRRHHLGTGEQA